MKFSIFFIVFVVLFSGSPVFSSDVPCAAKFTRNQSSVCVCNSTYCDTITRRQLDCGRYAAYTSSKDGSRFRVTEGYVEDLNINFTSKDFSKVFWIKPSQTYQTIEGFGGAVTDSAAILWKSLPEEAQRYFIESYFGESGIEYNMVRLPIGGSDYSLHFYAYNEIPENDVFLINFSLAIEDFIYKIPMLKASFKAAKDPVHIVASCWSPPRWMKTSNDWSGPSFLKPEFFQTYADYHCKFIEEYEKFGINIWAITTTNEPTNGVLFNFRIPDLGWTLLGMTIWLTQNLGPTIRKCGRRDTKILVGDDQRNFIPLWFNNILSADPKAIKYIDGIAVHFYSDSFVSASVVTSATKSYPDKFVINTEASILLIDPLVILGNWKNAEKYIIDVLEDLNYNLVGWIDWNLCLDRLGGPSCAGTRLDAAIIVDPIKGEFYKQPAFYALGHFSKFLPRGSKRVGVAKNFPTFLGDLEVDIELEYIPERDDIDNVAFITPRGTMVVIIYNKTNDKQVVAVIVKNKLISLQIEAQSITTVEFPYQSCDFC